MRHILFAAKANHLLDPRDRQLRPRRPRLIIEPRVEHAAVVTALMLADGSFLFQEPDAKIGPRLHQLVRRRQADNSPADNNDAFGRQLLLCGKS